MYKSAICTEGFNITNKLSTKKGDKVKYKEEEIFKIYDYVILYQQNPDFQVQFYLSKKEFDCYFMDIVLFRKMKMNRING